MHQVWIDVGYYYFTGRDLSLCCNLLKSICFQCDRSLFDMMLIISTGISKTTYQRCSNDSRSQTDWKKLSVAIVIRFTVCWYFLQWSLCVYLRSSAQIPRYIITLHELLAHTPHDHVERRSLQHARAQLEELSRQMHDEVKHGTIWTKLTSGFLLQSSFLQEAIILQVSETENLRKNLAVERMIIEGCDILLDVNQVFIRQGTQKFYVYLKDHETSWFTIYIISTQTLCHFRNSLSSGRQRSKGHSSSPSSFSIQQPSAANYQSHWRKTTFASCGKTAVTRCLAGWRSVEPWWWWWVRNRKYC